MQNNVRWRSDRPDSAVVGHLLGTLWSNKSDADSDCTVRMLLFFSIHKSKCRKSMK